MTPKQSEDPSAATVSASDTPTGVPSMDRVTAVPAEVPDCNTATPTAHFMARDTADII